MKSNKLNGFESLWLEFPHSKSNDCNLVFYGTEVHFYLVGKWSEPLSPEFQVKDIKNNFAWLFDSANFQSEPDNSFMPADFETLMLSVSRNFQQTSSHPKATIPPLVISDDRMKCYFPIRHEISLLACNLKGLH